MTSINLHVHVTGRLKLRRMHSAEYTRRYLEQAYSVPYNCRKLAFLLILETQTLRDEASVALELPVAVVLLFWWNVCADAFVMDSR